MGVGRVIPVVGVSFVIERQPTPSGPIRNLSPLKLPSSGANQSILVVLRVKPPRQHHLFVVVHAADAVRLGLGLGQGGQEQACQDGDDRDDDQQLDEGECLFPYYFHYQLSSLTNPLETRENLCLRF